MSVKDARDALYLLVYNRSVSSSQPWPREVVERALDDFEQAVRDDEHPHE